MIADRDQPVGPEVRVDLDERAAEGDDVDVVLEAVHRRASGAPVGLVEGAAGEAVLVGQLLQLLVGGIDDVDPGHRRLAERVHRLHRT